MENYWNSYGTLNARSEDINNINENSSYYTVAYVLKKSLTENQWGSAEVQALLNYYSLCKISDGLYNQLPFHCGNKDDYMSHDQLTAMMVFSKMFDLSIHEDIWAELKRQHFKYNNMEPGKGWIMHPRDPIYYGMLTGSKLWWLLYPLFILMIIWSQFGTETSGKCLNWFRLVGLGHFRMLRFFEWLMPKYASWKEVFATYFPDPQHPLNVAFRE